MSRAERVAEVLATENANLTAALDTIIASCESVGFMRDVDVPDPDSDDPAPIRTSRPTATVVAEMAAEVVRLRALVETKQTANEALVAELGGDVVRLARLQTYLETVAKSGPLVAGDLAAGLHPVDRKLMGDAVERFLLAYAEATDE